jgi:hypothetical protein
MSPSDDIPGEPKDESDGKSLAPGQAEELLAEGSDRKRQMKNMGDSAR